MSTLGNPESSRWIDSMNPYHQSAAGVKSQIVPYMKHAAVFLLPSFIQQIIDPSKKSTKKLSPTSYLDGLRGIAALFVLWYHISLKYFNMLLPYSSMPIGPNGTPANTSILQLPFVRLIISGRPMVHIFFVVSGYVLSVKSLRQMRAQQHEELLGTISSLVFRRGMRLFLPIIFSTLIGLILVHLDLREGRLPTFGDQLRHWFSVLSQVFNFWSTNKVILPDLDPQLWTITLEMANSIVLFAALISVARCRVLVRITLVGCLAGWFMYVGQWVASEFLMGTFLAELALMQDEFKSRKRDNKIFSSPSQTEQATFLFDGNESDEEAYCKDEVYLKSREERPHAAIQNASFEIFMICFKTVLILVLLPALWVAGWPEQHADQTWGFSYLIDMTPEPFRESPFSMQLPWFGLSAFLVVLAFEQFKFLQRVMTTGPMQYLGKISYSLYLLHWTLMECVMPRLVSRIYNWDVSLDEQPIGPWVVTLMWLYAVSITTLITVWVSDIFCSAINDNCVRFSKWFESWCIKDAHSRSNSRVE